MERPDLPARPRDQLTLGTQDNGVYGVKLFMENRNKPFILLEHRMGFEPMNTGFADQRVSHFATGAHVRRAL
jgi:hypothetical protein